LDAALRYFLLDNKLFYLSINTRIPSNYAICFNKVYLL
jgi:hypothetical protein